MIKFESVIIEGIDFNASGQEKVYQNLKMLLTTPENSIPFNRFFGINSSFMDEPLPIAKNRILVEYIEKTKKFEPRVSIQEVFFSEDQETGSLIPKVVVSVDLEEERIT